MTRLIYLAASRTFLPARHSRGPVPSGCHRLPDGMREPGSVEGELPGGDIAVQSAPGTGSVFTFMLPLDR